MGVCLSCLRGDEDELNEETSLLRNHQNIYGNDLEEAKLLKQQQRQQELNSIVNDLSDNLIDVTMFLNNESTVNPSLNSTMTKTDPEDPITDTFPLFISDEEKVLLLKKVNNLPEEVRNSCKIDPNDQLFLRF